MQKRVLLSILLIAILSACGIRSAFILKKTTPPELNEKTVVLNYIENRSAIILPVKINNKKYRFVYDTGAQATLISKEIMPRLPADRDDISLKKKSHINITDVRNSVQKLKVSVLDSLQLSPDLTYTGVGVLVYDFNKTPAFSCIQIDGVIGTNVIRQNNWKIDFDNHKVEVSGLEKEVKKTDKTIALPFSQDHRGVPYVDLFMNETEQQFMVDIGKNSDLISLSSELPFDEYQHKTVGHSSFGLFGKNKQDTITYGSANLTDSAQFEIKNIRLTHATHTHSLIGVGFLHKFYHTATFDYKNNQILLEKKENVNREIMNYPVSVMVGKNNLTISSKDINLSDIQIGDTVVGINKVDYDGSNTCELVEEVKNSRKNGNPIILRIKRLGVMSEFTFSLYPISNPFVPLKK
jgi:predicted aspartyl protease